MTVVVGGGAAGLCAAILIARTGLKITLLEQNDRIGKKILVSGNGKCNITNRHITPERFHSTNPEFVRNALEGYDLESVVSFFDGIGLVLQEGKEGKMFPMSMQAAGVVEILEYEAKRAGVNILCGCRVERIGKTEEGFVLETSLGVKQCQTLLITAGSVAAEKLGGNNSGYMFASSLGHALIPRHPALVQLCSEEAWVQACAGVKIPGVATLYANGEEIMQKEGDLLFTNYGISGLAILDLSREVSLRLAAFEYCELSLDLLPSYSKERLTNLLTAHITKGSDKPLLLWLQGFMHKKLAKVVLEHAKCQSAQEGALNRKEINRIVHTIKHLKLGISDTRGFAYAEVATGGVDTAQIDPETMASKLVPNLYFAGEVLDVDGDRGGYNFHFAWVSAMRAAEAINRSIRSR